MFDDLVIRAASVEDFVEAARIDREAMGADGYPLYFFRQALSMFDDGFLVAVQGEEMLGQGFVGARAGDPETAELYSIVVAKAARGQGVGRKLTAASIDWAARQGCRRIVLTVSPDNAPAYAIYESLGFQIEHREENYYGDGAPRLFMTRDF